MFLSKTGEPVEIEKWTWVAIYDDDSALVQFDFNKDIYNYFDDIQKEKVVKFGLVNTVTGKNTFLDIPKGAKLIHFYDNILQSPQGGSTLHHRLYCFGYELKKDKVIKTILPNDFIISADPSDIGVI
jgi:hypothetical protein